VDADNAVDSVEVDSGFPVQMGGNSDSISDVGGINRRCIRD
jgi:hypothetical protein